MASIRRISFLAGSAAAAALVAAIPAQAEEQFVQPSVMADSTTEIAATPAEAAVEATGLEMADYLNPESEAVAPEAAPVDVAQVAPQPIDVAAVDASAIEGTASTSADSFFEGTEASNEPQEIAQVTRPLYRGVAPFYVGVGGNIGIIDSDESSVGDFGFNIISKVSFGPRFSIRPTLGVSEDDVNFTVPLTYNFNPVELGEFSVYPFAGAGADISNEIGLLLNGGVDIPISRDFTLNGQVNWRATNDTGLGLSLGVGYNFPFFFE